MVRTVPPPLTGRYVLEQAPCVILVLVPKLFVLAWIKSKAVIFGGAGWAISAVGDPLALRANPDFTKAIVEV